MDIKRIKNALHEDGAAASGTSATPGPGAIGGGIQPFKAKMGCWRKNNEEVDPQAPGVVQSTQHASDAQLSNPMRETTHEEVNLFDEERIPFNVMPVPFSGLQMGDLESGINYFFDKITKIVEYNIANSTDPTNTNTNALQAKYETLKHRAIAGLEDNIELLHDGMVNKKERELNLSDIYLVICLMKAYGGDNDGMDPKVYAKKLCERLLDIARNDALELVNHLYKTLIPKLKSSKVTLMSMIDETIEAINNDKWAEALVWNKLRKTVELMKKPEEDDDDFDAELPQVEPEVEPEAELEPVSEMEGSGTKTSFPTQTTSDVTPVQASGMPSKCPSFPLQGNQAIHEEDAPPQNEIQPLPLGDVSIEGYFVIENNKPTLIRYKVIKGGAPIPVDPKKANSEDIGHTKEQVLKKLSIMPQKVPFIRKFLAYNKANETTLKTKQQEKMG